MGERVTKAVLAAQLDAERARADLLEHRLKRIRELYDALTGYEDLSVFADQVNLVLRGIRDGRV